MKSKTIRTIIFSLLFASGFGLALLPATAEAGYPYSNKNYGLNLGYNGYNINFGYNHNRFPINYGYGYNQRAYKPCTCSSYNQYYGQNYGYGYGYPSYNYDYYGYNTMPVYSYGYRINPTYLAYQNTYGMVGTWQNYLVRPSNTFDFRYTVNNKHVTKNNQVQNSYNSYGSKITDYDYNATGSVYKRNSQSNSYDYNAEPLIYEYSAH